MGGAVEQLFKFLVGRPRWLALGAAGAFLFLGLGLAAAARLRFEDFASMFHGNDERVDQESLRLSTELWMALAHEFLG